MLTPQEELVLKQFARDHTPMQVVNPQTTPSDNESAHAAEKHVNEHFRRAGTRPMTVYGGPTDGMKTPFVEAERDWDFENRIAHVRHPGEPVLAFIARSGLSPVQARTISKEAITRFVAAADARNNEEWSPDRKPWRHDAR